MNYFNKRFTTPILVTFASIALTACGSDGGGGGPLATGGFTKSFGTVDDSGNALPFIGGSDAKTQVLYTADEINGSGNITTLRFHRSSATAAVISCPNVTVKLGHSSLSAVTTTFAANVEQGKGTQVTVLNDATVDIPVGAIDTWFDIPLTTPFNYNGVDSLVVEVDKTAACTSSQFTTSFTAATNRFAFSSASDTGASTAEHDQVTALLSIPTQPWIQFDFAGGDNRTTIDGVSAVSNFPFTTTATAQKVQLMYVASEINGSGPITGIGFKVGGLTSAQTYTLNVKMGHTTLASVAAGSTFSSNYSAAPTTVAAGKTFTVPAGVPVGEYVWLPFTSSFNYNGTDNLIVEIEATAASGVFIPAATTAVFGRRIMGAVGSPIADGAGTNSVAYIAKFRFNGGTTNVITNAGSATGFPFATTTAGVINLYRATELGSAGSIYSVACRMSSATSTASTFDNYQVILGHSNVATLDTTTANNLVSPQVAYDGALDLPAGLVQGDWVTIDLTTPFVYDGVSNLVVWMGTTSTSAGATGHSCIQSSADATAQPGQTANATPSASVTITTKNNKFDMQLGIAK